MTISSLFEAVPTWLPRMTSIRVEGSTALDFIFLVILQKDGEQSFRIIVAEARLNADSVMCGKASEYMLNE